MGSCLPISAPIPHNSTTWALVLELSMAILLYSSRYWGISVAQAIQKCLEGRAKRLHQSLAHSHTELAVISWVGPFMPAYFLPSPVREMGSL